MPLRFMIFLTLLGSAAPGAEPSLRQPTGKWVVDFDDAQCVAWRPYGSAEHPLHLVLKAPPVGDVIQMGLMRKGSSGDPHQLEATVQIDGRPPMKLSMLTFGAGRGKLRPYLLNISSADFAPVRGGKVLTIRSRGLDERLSISQFRPLLKIMDQCVADLRQVWNVTDLKGEKSLLAKRAEGDFRTVIKPDDYPAAAIENQQSGTVRFAALINEQGRVADCTVIATSGVAALDTQTCAAIKARAKFKPAVGPDGKPAKDALIQTVNWRIEK